MKFLVCLMFFLVTAGFASGQSVQGVHSCSAQGPPGLPGRDGRDGMPGRDCPCGTKDTQISELQSKYQELRDQNEDLEQRLSVLEEGIGNTTHQSGSADTQISELQSKHQELRDQNEDLEQRLSILEDSIGNTTHQSGSAGYPPSSCTEVAERSGIHDQAFYVIDPDGPGRGVLPMVVQCDLEGQTPITLISHDSEARTHVNGFENPGSYSKDVTYWNSMEQVRAVVDQASSCKQHIKYECHGSVIWSGSTPYAWWVTWDGRQADYWGGASPRSGKCACGETGTCSNRCNCDANDNTWREDSGFLSHKNDLPVTQLRFGDTGGSQEDGYYTLGKLICYP